MSTSTITVGGQTVTLVSFPTAPGLKGYDFTIDDPAGIVPSSFTGQIAQVQQWPGADMWRSTLTIAPRSSVDADDWVSFLMELRGQANAFQLGDVRKATPRGSVAGTPVVDGTVAGGNPATLTQLATRGWTTSAANVLRRGDQIQVRYRLYQVLADVSADGSGKAVLPIWPSIREALSDGDAITTSSPKALWRLAVSQRQYSYDITRLVRGIKLPIMEYR